MTPEVPRQQIQDDWIQQQVAAREAFQNYGYMEFNTVEERNTWLNERVDPEGTLPKVEIDLSDNSDSYVDEGFVSIRDEQGERRQIAKLEWAKPGPDNERPHIWEIDMAQEYKGKGYGLATYLELMKRLPLGLGMDSDDHISGDAYRVWRRLERAGVAIADYPTKIMDETIQNLAKNDIPAYGDVHVKFRTVFGGTAAEAAAVADKRAREEAREKFRVSRTGRALGKLGLHR